ncbi:hypothetical protein CGX12_11760, partial [Zobellella denitrificans]
LVAQGQQGRGLLAERMAVEGDAASPISKLEALAARRALWLDEQQLALADIKAGLSGSLFRVSASGTPGAIAAALAGGLPGYERGHAAAVLLTSAQPLTFFEELLP